MKDEEIIALMLKLGMRFSIPDVQYSLLDGEVIATQNQIDAFARSIADLQKEKDAQICENLDTYEIEIRQDCANAIRSPESDLDEALRRQ